MKVLYETAEVKRWRRKHSGSVGFVPTMGYLHEGHVELIRRARAENKNVAVSIFVNPTQFGPREDFAAYPRDPERDLSLLKQEKVDVVFMPDAEEIYPPQSNTWVEVGSVTERLEDAFRPGHFRGVATVVAKLFGIVEPTRAYFGQKDAQQLVVIRKMVDDLNMNVEVVAVPTVRELDGLAMSSRNVYLDPEERESAVVLYKALSRAQKLWGKGERSAELLRKEITSLIESEPKATIDYVSIADPETLEELEQIEDHALVSMAVRIGKTRLIDSMTLGK
ncbi:MAG: pantoate--beta-alanine ligase [Dehalococcoidia bacterium]|nr:MAG: pantoate--beta-alanine ligase [Dehalococcoidia bacterium]